VCRVAIALILCLRCAASAAAALGRLHDPEFGVSALAPRGWELWASSRRDSLTIALKERTTDRIANVAQIDVAVAESMGFAASASPFDVVADLMRKRAKPFRTHGWWCAEDREDEHAVCARRRAGSVRVGSYQGPMRVYLPLGGVTFLRLVAESAQGITPLSSRR
jgi:hypothetical protein